MRALLSVALCLLGLASKVAHASPANAIPPAAIITPAPALHKRFDNDFVGYVLFDDGDSMFTKSEEPRFRPIRLTPVLASILTCKAGYTYTYDFGYAGCVSSLGDLGTACSGSTMIFTGGDTLEWSGINPKYL
jgi:hypothetical protein